MSPHDIIPLCQVNVSDQCSVTGLQQICDSYSLENREYFFDRSPRNFDAILGLYRNGKLHLPAGVCVQVSWQWEDIFILSSYILY